jgi:hypothetical protein
MLYDVLLFPETATSPSQSLDAKQNFVLTSFVHLSMFDRRSIITIHHTYTYKVT